MDQERFSVCRYCLDDNDKTSICPCSCKQPVHQHCIQKWYAVNTRSTRDICEICGKQFAMAGESSGEQPSPRFTAIKLILVLLNFIAIIGVSYDPKDLSLELNMCSRCDEIIYISGMLSLVAYIIIYIIVIAKHDGKLIILLPMTTVSILFSGFGSLLYSLLQKRFIWNFITSSLFFSGGLLFSLIITVTCRLALRLGNFNFNNVAFINSTN